MNMCKYVKNTTLSPLFCTLGSRHSDKGDQGTKGKPGVQVDLKLQGDPKLQDVGDKVRLSDEDGPVGAPIST